MLFICARIFTFECFVLHKINCNSFLENNFPSIINKKFSPIFNQHHDVPPKNSLMHKISDKPEVTSHACHHMSIQNSQLFRMKYQKPLINIDTIKINPHHQREISFLLKIERGIKYLKSLL